MDSIVRAASFLVGVTVIVGCSGGGGTPEYVPQHVPVSELTAEQRRAIRDIMHPFQDPPNDVAEPSIDVTNVLVGQTTEPAGGVVGIGIRTTGGPPDESEYSSYCGADVENEETAETASVVTQHHDGQNDVLVEGLTPGDVTAIKRPWGFYLQFPRPAGWLLGDFVIDIECGFMETSGSPFLQDVLDEGPIEVIETNPVEDVLAEIELVFVPS